MNSRTRMPGSVAVLGPAGTFTEEAAVSYFGSSGEPMHFFSSVEEIFDAIRRGEARYGVVPVENSTEGAVARTFDAFLADVDSSAGHEPRIIGEVLLRVRHQLMGSAALLDHLNEIDEVLAHPQALAQCRLWLQKNLKNAKLIPVSSNAEGARLASLSPRTAAIGSERAAGIYHHSLLAREIQDEPDNSTRFWVLGGAGVPTEKNAVCNKTSLLLMVSNRPGVLYQALEPLARHQVDLHRIESRPSRKGLWDYVFFIDIHGAPEQPEVAAALSEVSARVERLRVLGTYRGTGRASTPLEMEKF